MPTCHHCSVQIFPEDKFCGHCGTALKALADSHFQLREQKSNIGADADSSLMPASGATMKNLSLQDIRLDLAVVYMRQKNYARVIEECDKILHQTPNHAKALELKEQAVKLSDSVSFEAFSEDMP